MKTHPCPICYAAGCTRHLAGQTDDGETLTHNREPLRETDIIFGALPAALVYRREAKAEGKSKRLYSPPARKA